MELMRIPNMNQAKRTSLFLIIIFLIICLEMAVLPASAQEQEPDVSGITISAEAGFDGYYKNQLWVPVQITVANNGPAIEGQIRLVTGDLSTNDRVVYTTVVSLPTQSNKRLNLAVGLTRMSSTLIVELLDDKGEVVAQAETNVLRQQNLDTLLYGVVSSDPGDLDFLEDVTGGRSYAAVAFLDIEDLSPIAPAWNTLDVLLFNDVDTGQLTADQRTALQSWVSTGGQLIVSGGPGWQKTVAAFTEMLPVTLTGSESVEDLPALSAAVGLSFRDPGPYLLAASSLSSGELLYHQDGLPLLAQQDLGRGAVYFLALDPNLAPLRDWDGAKLLFGQVANNVPQLSPWSMGIETSNQAGAAVSSLPSLALPSAAQLALFLLVYVIVIGPVNYIYLRRKGRRELAWVTIPILVILFTGTAYIMGFQLKGNKIIINQLNVAYGQMGSDEVRVQTLVGLYSPRRSRYDLILPADVAARPFNREYSSIGDSTNLATVARGNSLVMSEVLVDVGGVETFVADSYRLAPSISGQAQMNLASSGVELEITLQNNGQIELENVTVLVGSRAINLGDFSPGESLSDTFPMGQTSLATGSAIPAFGPSYGSDFPLLEQADVILGTSDYNDPITYPRWQLLQALDNRYYGTSGVTGYIPNNVATIVAWSDKQQLDITLNAPNFDSLNTTLYFLEVPIQHNLGSGNSIQIPEALLNWEVLASGGNIYGPTITNLYLPSDSWVEFEFTPWQEFEQIEVTALAVRLLTAGNNGVSVPIVRLWDWQEEIYVDVDQVSWGNTAVADFQQFIGPDKSIRLHLRNSNSVDISINEVYPVLTGNFK